MNDGWELTHSNSSDSSLARMRDVIEVAMLIIWEFKRRERERVW